MHYDTVENSIQAAFQQIIPLSQSQLRRVREIVVALMLAGNTRLTQVARQICRPTNQDSRVQFIRRLISSPLTKQSPVYMHWIKHLLASYRKQTLHLAIDRTELISHTYDLVSVNLSFRKRSIPVVWEVRPTGMTGTATQISLLERCLPLIPADRQIVFHGDNEFGSGGVMRWCDSQHWHFILAQAAKHYIRQPGQPPVQCGDLPVTKTRAVYQHQVMLTKRHWYGPVNLFAFYQPKFNKKSRKQDIRYYATSLPITKTLRRIGRRRWGIECYYNDLKSAGWDITQSNIRQIHRLEGLLTVLNLTYSWATCVGRWLCKTSQRRAVDSNPDRHLSLFRIGLDYIVHKLRSGDIVPSITTLYS